MWLMLREGGESSVGGCTQLLRKRRTSLTGPVTPCGLTARTGVDQRLGRVDIHDFETGELVRTLSYEEPSADGWLLDVTFSPDGRLLAAGDWDGRVTLWDVSSGSRRKTFTETRGGVHCVEFSPDGKKLAVGSEDQTLRILDVPSE